MILKRLLPIFLALFLLIASPLPSRAETAGSEVTVLTIIDVVPDYAMAHNEEDARELLRGLAVNSQREPGVISFHVLGDTTRSNHFIMLAVFKNMHFYDVYSGAKTTRDFRQAFEAGMDGPFDERIYADLK